MPSRAEDTETVARYNVLTLDSNDSNFVAWLDIEWSFECIRWNWKPGRTFVIFDYKQKREIGFSPYSPRFLAFFQMP